MSIALRWNSMMYRLVGGGLLSGMSVHLILIEVWSVAGCGCGSVALLETCGVRVRPRLNSLTLALALILLVEVLAPDSWSILELAEVWV
jgi:hypothetical protein